MAVGAAVSTQVAMPFLPIMVRGGGRLHSWLDLLVAGLAGATACACLTLWHMRNNPALFRERARVLAVGGIFAVYDR